MYLYEAFEGDFSKLPTDIKKAIVDSKVLKYASKHGTTQNSLVKIEKGKGKAFQALKALEKRYGAIHTFIAKIEDPEVRSGRQIHQINGTAIFVATTSGQRTETIISKGNLLKSSMVSSNIISGEIGKMLAVRDSKGSSFADYLISALEGDYQYEIYAFTDDENDIVGQRAANRDFEDPLARDPRSRQRDRKDQAYRNRLNKEHEARRNTGLNGRQVDIKLRSLTDIKTFYDALYDKNTGAIIINGKYLCTDYDGDFKSAAFFNTISPHDLFNGDVNFVDFKLSDNEVLRGDTENGFKGKSYKIMGSMNSRGEVALSLVQK